MQNVNHDLMVYIWDKKHLCFRECTPAVRDVFNNLKEEYEKETMAHVKACALINSKLKNTFAHTKKLFMDQEQTIRRQEEEIRALKKRIATLVSIHTEILNESK